MYNKAKKKIDKELELEEFIKMQKYLKTVQNCFFSRFERMLINQSKYFVIEADPSKNKQKKAPI